MLTCYLLNQNNIKATIVDLADFVKETVNVSDIKKLLDTNRLVLLDRTEILGYTNFNKILSQIIQACRKDELNDWVTNHGIPMLDYRSKGDCLGLYKVYDYSATLGMYVILLRYTDGLGLLVAKLNNEFHAEFIFGNKLKTRNTYPICAGSVHKRLFGATNLMDNKTYLAVEYENDKIMYLEVN